MNETEIFVLVFPLIGQILSLITEYFLSKTQPYSREETSISVLIKLVLGFYIGIASYKIYTFGSLLAGSVLSIFVGSCGISVAIINLYVIKLKKKSNAK